MPAAARASSCRSEQGRVPVHDRVHEPACAPSRRPACRLRPDLRCLPEPDGQNDALTAAGCEKIFADTASGKLAERPELTVCLGYLRAGDALVVWRLDRLGRSLRHLVETVNALADRRVAFASLHEGIDTSTSKAAPPGPVLIEVFLVIVSCCPARLSAEP
jgi:DNA invertase Pin-like site-specific DNA recombinase